VAPEDVAVFLAWKREASERMGEAAGLLGRAMYHSTENPRRYLNVIRWASEGRMAAVATDPAFREASGKARAGMPNTSVTIERMLELPEHRVAPAVEPKGEAPMYVIHATWDVPANEVEAFLAWKRIEGAMQERMPGFVGRTLYQNLDNPGRYVYLALWESDAHARAYGADPAFREASQKARAAMPKTVIAIDRMVDMPEHALTPVR
jgi:heme-degrading monooxygenase HmoA